MAAPPLQDASPPTVPPPAPLMYRLLRTPLFMLPAERAHTAGHVLLRIAGALPGWDALRRVRSGPARPELQVRLWERDFANPVGLAAGFDKDGTSLAGLAGLGFGLLEAGTVTPRAQPGNPQPRLFRLPAAAAIINRMGFNNAGAAALARRLEPFRARQRRGAFAGLHIGVNLGKNKETPNEAALEDYRAGMRALYHLADYLVINISSPNTPQLRELQQRPALSAMVAGLQETRAELRAQHGTWVPLLIKVAPDLSHDELADVVAVALEQGCDGLIATNTTLGRPGVEGPVAAEAGGLSGAPLFPRALEVVATLHRLSGGKLPLVGVGGIASAEQAYAFIRAGASLVQVYSALIYQGPGLPRRITRGLVRLLRRDGFTHIAQAVGVDAPALAATGEPKP